MHGYAHAVFIRIITCENEFGEIVRFPSPSVSMWTFTGSESPTEIKPCPGDT